MSRERRPGEWGTVRLTFGRQELVDLAVAWGALGLAFAVFFAGGAVSFLAGAPVTLLAVSMVTAGVGFLLHELAHKVAAVRLDTPAAFRADYGMLFVALMAATAGFLFAAPGAVYHPRTVSDREQAVIAAAGPVTNLGLAALFVPLTLVDGSLPGLVGNLGVYINLLLAGFNMIPFGPLDGRKVLDYSAVAFAALAVPSIGLAVLVLFG